MAASIHVKRQGSAFDNSNTNDPNGYDDYNYYYGGPSWWWTSTGMGVRYAVVAFIFVLIFAYFLGGYWHAKRRVAKGLPPLAYHRWMVRRRQRNDQQYMRVPPERRWNENQHAYPMDAAPPPPPPPAYNAEYAPPPVYQPPDGGSKIAADQNYQSSTNRAGESSGGLNMPAAARARDT